MTNIPINNYATFKYVKQQLKQKLIESETKLKGSLVNKVPFGLGNAFVNFNENEGGLKEALKKEALNSSIPLVKNFVFSLLKNHKKRLFIWGISAVGGMTISLLINKKLK